MTRRPLPDDRTSRRTNAEVLIVGAGPVGTALACDLLQRGIDVRLIDASDEPAPSDPHSRAILLVPRSLGWLATLGIETELLARGRRLPAITYFSDGRRLGQARFDRLRGISHPFLLALPQRQTEAVLTHRLHQLGAHTEHGTALIEIDSTQPVQATLRRRDGQIETIWPRYLVGADGAASTTRRLLGSQLAGDPTDITYLIADAPLTGPIGDNAQYHYSTRGLLAIVPMNDGVFRIAGDIPHQPPTAKNHVQPNWQTILQTLVDERAAGKYRVGAPTYTRTVRPRCGIADQFRHGNVLLVGDAAHVISPAGGQGMNLGFGDAANLGWTLAEVLSGRRRADTLDDYTKQRRAAAIRTASATARIVRFARQRTRLRARIRDLIFLVADRSGMVQRYLTPLLSQLDVDLDTLRAILR